MRDDLKEEQLDELESDENQWTSFRECSDNTLRESSAWICLMITGKKVVIFPIAILPTDMKVYPQHKCEVL